MNLDRKEAIVSTLSVNLKKVPGGGDRSQGMEKNWNIPDTSF